MAYEVMNISTADGFQVVGFTVDNEEFAVDILKVQEIIRMVDITKMPNAPAHIEGVINLRGKVIPVIDFRKRFNLYGDDDGGTDTRRIVVINVRSATVGLVVDKVSQVIKLSSECMSPAPETGKTGDSECISGIGKIGDKLVILLDLEKMLNQDDIDVVAQAA